MEELRPISHTKEVIDALAEIEAREHDENNERFKVLLIATITGIALIFLIGFYPKLVESLLADDRFAFF